MERKKAYVLALVIVILGAAAIITMFDTGYAPGSAGNLSAYDNVQVPSYMLSRLNIPENISNSVGNGGIYNYPQNISNPKVPSLQSNGKPEVLYMGAEFCPYCAAQRWALIIALSRFGTFSNIRYMTSSLSDKAYPGTPTFTFANSTYASQYISFVSVETMTNLPTSNGGYAPLQTPTSLESSIISIYDPSGSIPFLDFANRSVIIGSTYLPDVLQGQNWSTIISQLYSPGSASAQSIIGSADIMTAEICKIDGNQPLNVCGQNYITQIEKNEAFR